MICISCLLDKPEEEYPFRDKKAGTRQNKCKSCARSYSKDHYRRNKIDYLKKARIRNSRHRGITRWRLWNYLLQHPCVDCGESDPIVLEFDHVNGDKEFTIAECVRGGYSWQHILKEIEKCEVRCANCHLRKTAIQFGWYKNLVEPTQKMRSCKICGATTDLYPQKLLCRKHYREIQKETMRKRRMKR